MRITVVAAAVACAIGAVTAGTPAAKAAPAPPPQDPFYTYGGSAPLAGIAPGTVLKTRAVSLQLQGLTVPVSTEQVLYRTTGERGQPAVTVTTIIKPVVSVTARKIVAYQNAYDALGAQCDPSYTLQGGNNADTTGQAEEIGIAAYVAAGDTVTVPDYEGENLEWGAGQESGYGTLDAIRATEHHLGVPSSAPAGMLGYSGGSIATEWAAETAPSYAPDLHLVGAAIGGVPVDYAHVLSYINGDTSWAGVIPAVLDSLPKAFGADLTPYLSAHGKQVLSQVAGKCIGDFATAYPGLTIQQLLLPRYSDPYKIPAVVNILNHLIMGTTPGRPPGEPMLMGVGNSDGTGDGIMVAGDVRELAYQYCQRGVPVTFTQYQGLAHTPAFVPFQAAALTFLTSRLTGLPAPDGCAAITPGNSLAPLPPPSS